MASVVAAYTAAWLILMVYLGTLAARQRRLEHALRSLPDVAPRERGTLDGAHVQ